MADVGCDIRSMGWDGMVTFDLAAVEVKGVEGKGRDG